MPKFLLVTIFILVALGQIFKVEDYSRASIRAGVVDIETTKQMKIEDQINSTGESVEIIRWPLVNGNENEEKMPVPINEGEECLFFDEDIPRLGTCLIEQ